MEKIRSWIHKMGRKQWAVMLLAGILLAVIVMPVSDTTDQKSGMASILSGTDKNTTVESSSGEVTKSELEAKLESLLSHVEGVGQAEVILMTGEEKSGSFDLSETTQVTGVLISVQGGDDAVIVHKIQEAVMALFQIEAHKIKVMKMK